MANHSVPLAKRPRGSSDPEPVNTQSNSAVPAPKKKKRTLGGKDGEEVEIDNPGMMC